MSVPMDTSRAEVASVGLPQTAPSAPLEGSTAPMDGVEANGTGPQSAPRTLPVLKVPFYELLVRQLQDDGFVEEAQSICRQLHVQPNTLVERDSLMESYGKSLKWAFGDEPQGQWVPMHCTPVPPLGPNEKVLDFSSTLKPSESLGKATPPVPPPPGQALAPGQGGPVVGEPHALPAKRAPDIRLLYTCQHKQSVRSVTFSTDGRFCATGCADGSIKVLDCARMRVCAASTDGPLGRIRVTEEELMRPITRTLHDHVLGITCLAFHPMNPTLFSGSGDKAVKIFDLTRPPGHKKAFSVLQDVHPVRCLAIHPCGDFLLVGTSHQAVRLYDLQTLNCFTAYHQDHHHNAGINDVRCTSDGRVFATASADGAVQLWDAVSQRVVNRLPRAHSGAAVTSVRWSRTGNYLLSSGADGRHRMWDVRQGGELFNMGFGPRQCEFSTAVFAAGERYVAATNGNPVVSDVSLFDAQTGSLVYMKLGMHMMPVRALDASPADRTLITGCDDEKARYFSAEDRGGS